MDIAPFLWLMAPQYISVEGTVAVEGGYVHVVASFAWTHPLPSMGVPVDHIWVALPRETFNAADTEVQFLDSAPGIGSYLWAYGVEEVEPYDPTIGYLGRLTVNGDDGVMQLIRGECYDFLTFRDQFAEGVTAISGDMDLKWKWQEGIEPSDLPGATSVGGGQSGVVRSRRRRPTGPTDSPGP